jgi:SAM-dependent methyltransferase
MSKVNTKTINLRPFFSQFVVTVKQVIKSQRSSKNPIIKILISSLYFSRNSLKYTLRIFIDADYRSSILVALLNSKNVHQTTPLTFMNRYPVIFSACQDYFKEKKELRILSYGCSTGEEVLTLRKYFSSANIVGAEINKRSLKICQNRTVDEKISFIYSTQSEIQKNGPYDVIFSMAVLQREPHVITAKGITSLKNIYPFEKFEETIIELDKLVTRGGLLVVHYTQYSLLDTDVAPKYQALGKYNQNDYTEPVFDKNSYLIKNPSQQNSIFIKLHE